MLNKEQIARVDDAVSQVRKLLDDCEIPYEKDVVEENENVHIFTTVVNGYQYVGLIGWDVENNHIRYVAFDEDRIRRNELEGFGDEHAGNEIAWCPKDLDMFFSFLTGEVREIMKRSREEQVKKLNQECV